MVMESVVNARTLQALGLCAAQDNIGVARRDLHAVAAAAGAVGGNQGCAGAEEYIKDNIINPRHILHSSLWQSNGKTRLVVVLLRARVINLPNIAADFPVTLSCPISIATVE